MRSRYKFKKFIFAVLLLSQLANGSNDYSSYQNSNSIKVVFSKKYFYSNDRISSQGCSGDASTYFDPQLDRALPQGIRPTWLKNVSLELTNANAPFGASDALYCSYGITGTSLDPACLDPTTAPSYCSSTPQPSNCAAFDDFQQTTGARSKAYILGGYNCESTTTGKGCTNANGHVSRTIWSVTMDDTTNAATPFSAARFQRSSLLIPSYSGTENSIFGGWDFDHIHNWLMGYGGVRFRNGLATLYSALMRLTQGAVPESNDDPSLIGIQNLNVTDTDDDTNIYAPIDAVPRNHKASAAGLRESGGVLTQPSARGGHSFTYIPRRTPSLARRYIDMTGANCTTTDNNCLVRNAAASATDDVSGWEDSDYFLSIGGFTSAFTLSSAVAALLPHRLSNHDGSEPLAARDKMSWEWLSHNSATGGVTIMPAVDLSLTGKLPGSTASSWYHTSRFSRTNGSGVFPARAFHRAVYDSRLDRVYVFGGLITNITGTPTNTGSLNDKNYAGTVSAQTEITATNEMWIFDPPGLGKRPTLACRTSTNPRAGSAQSLPGLLSTTSLYGVAQGIGIRAHIPDFSTYTADDLNFETSTEVFPAGGCMQFAQPVTATLATLTTEDDGGTAQTYVQPASRLEHAMAFDERQGVVLLFGGCTKAPAYDSVGGTGLANGTPATVGGVTLGLSPLSFDPLSNCTTRESLLNDTWVYLPPEIRESALMNAFSGETNQFTINRPDLVGFEPAYLGQPLPQTTASTQDFRSQTHGTWIKLTSDSYSTNSDATLETQPDARAGAAFWYDKAHGKFYLFGGKTCSAAGACRFLNDFWEFTPPSIAGCTRSYYSSASEVGCGSSGSWRRLDNDTIAAYSLSPSHVSNNYPSQGMLMKGVYAQRAPGDYNHYGDHYYTVSDAACSNQGPFVGSQSTSKEQVGAIYIDLDRQNFSTNENLLINLKTLPFAAGTTTSAGVDQKNGTKLPGYNFSGTYGANTNDDRDVASSNDNAIIRVTLMANPYSSITNILSQHQPRFRSYQPPGTPTISYDFDLAGSGTGQPTEKQILVPLPTDARIDLIKIERLRGTVKFFEMTLSKF